MKSQLLWTTESGVERAEAFGLKYIVCEVLTKPEGLGSYYLYRAIISGPTAIFATDQSFDEEVFAKAWCQSHADAISRAIDLALKSDPVRKQAREALEAVKKLNLDRSPVLSANIAGNLVNAALAALCEAPPPAEEGEV